MIMRKTISILCFLVMAAMKYVRIISVARIIINISKIFKLSPH